MLGAVESLHSLEDAPPTGRTGTPFPSLFPKQRALSDVHFGFLRLAYIELTLIIDLKSAQRSYPFINNKIYCKRTHSFGDRLQRIQLQTIGASLNIWNIGWMDRVDWGQIYQQTYFNFMGLFVNKV